MVIVNKMKKIDSVYWQAFAVAALFSVFAFIYPDLASAAVDDATVKSRLKNAADVVKGILTGLVTVIGVIAVAKVVIKHMPSLDDPHVKNEMWKSVGSIAMATGAVGACIWLIPWVYALLRS